MSVAWVGTSSLSGPVRKPLVERFEGDVINRNGSLVVELAQRHAQPGAVGSVVDEVFQLEVEQFTDANPGVAQTR